MTLLTLRRASALLAAALALVSPAAAAVDDCAAAIPISAGDLFNVDTTSATTDGPGAACAFINRDTWFTYTATATGTLTISTCTTVAPLDTVVVIYAGTCGSFGGIVGCNDDFCDLRSSASGTVFAGQTYLVRVGSFNESDGGIINVGCSFAPLGAAAITYQGKLSSAGAPVEGPADLTFQIFDSPVGGFLYSTNFVRGVTVTEGLFTAPINPTLTSFDYTNKWLEIAVADPVGSDNFIILSPRQPLTAAPSAVIAASVSPGAVNAAGLALDAGSLARVSAGNLSISSGKVQSAVNVRAPDFEYSAPVTSYIAVGPATFQSRDGEPVKFQFGFGGAFAGNAGSTTILYSPLQLPHGCTVTEISVFYVDNAANDLFVALEGHDYIGGGNSTIASFSTSGSSNALRTTSILLSLPIDNTTNDFHLRVQPNGGSWPGTNGLSIVGARIKYTATKPGP